MSVCRGRRLNKNFNFSAEADYGCRAGRHPPVSSGISGVLLLRGGVKPTGELNGAAKAVYTIC